MNVTHYYTQTQKALKGTQGAKGGTMSQGSSVEAIAQRLITQKQMAGLKERTNATYDGANGVMAGSAMNPLNSTSMTASGMSL